MFKFNKVFKKPRYLVIQQNVQQEAPGEKIVVPAIPNGLWTKCTECSETIYTKDFHKNYKVCQNCGYHYRINSVERLDLVIDTGTFKELDPHIKSVNPLDFEGYEDKLIENQQQSQLQEAVVTGYGKIHGLDTVVVVMDSSFMMGSMGSVVGEKITRAFEFAIFRRMPIIIFTASGGARMQEGMFSLMQMAKTSAVVARHDQAGGLYITVLTDPTTGGVTASFAMLGDIILSEPGALIGFAGKRVIEQTIKQQLPEGFQTAEFLMDHGFVDKIVAREKMKLTLSRLIKLHQKK